MCTCVLRCDSVASQRGQKSWTNAALAETHTDNGKSRGNKLTKDDLAKLSDRPGRHGDGGGLYFRAIGERRAYFVYRYRIAGKEREISIGPYPEVSLAEARIKHAAFRKTVVSDKRDPVAEKRAAKVSAISAPPPSRPSANAPTVTLRRTLRRGETRRAKSNGA